MIFFIPFFFLLDDSSLVSTGVALVAVELSAVLDDVVAGCAASVLVDDPAGAAAAPASATGAGDPLAFGLATAAFPVAGALASAAGLAVVSGALPGVLTGVLPGVLTGVEVAPAGATVVPGCESGPVLIISTPTLGCPSLPAAGPVRASSGVTGSVPVSAGVCELAAPPATVNAGPCAPGRSTSVAETTSFGGFSCGVPPCAAVEKSGSPLIIDIGIFSAMT